MIENTVVEIVVRESFEDSLTELLGTGARQLIGQAMEAELTEFMEQFLGRLLSDGRTAVVIKQTHKAPGEKSGITRIQSITREQGTAANGFVRITDEIRLTQSNSPNCCEQK